MKREPKRMEIGTKAKEKPLTKSGLKLITLYRFPTMPFDVFVSLSPHLKQVGFYVLLPNYQVKGLVICNINLNP